MLSTTLAVTILYHITNVEKLHIFLGPIQDTEAVQVFKNLSQFSYQIYNNHQYNSKYGIFIMGHDYKNYFKHEMPDLLFVFISKTVKNDAINFFENLTNSIILSISNDQHVYIKHNSNQFKTYSKSNYTQFLITFSQDLKVSIFQKRFTAVKQNDTYVGFDGEILKIIKEKLNINLDIIESDKNFRYGHKLENGTFVGAIGDIINEKADMTGNTFFIKDYNTTDVEFSTPVLSDKLCIAVPSSSEIPKWKVIFRAFDTMTWIFVIFAYFLSVIILYVFKKQFKVKAYDIDSCSFYVFEIFISNTILVPKKVSGRLFVTTLIIAAFVLTKSFEGSLLGLLTRASYYRDINTLSELDKSGLKIFTLSKNLQKDIFNSNVKTMQNLAKKLYLHEQYGDDMIYLVHKKREFGYVGRRYDIAKRITDIPTDTERVKVHIVNECIGSYGLAYVFKKNSLYYPKINSLLGRLVSSGIIHSPTVNKGYGSTEIFKWKEKINIPLSLRFTNLVISFIILLFGHILSILVFIYEIYSKKIQN